MHESASVSAFDEYNKGPLLGHIGNSGSGPLSPARGRAVHLLSTTARTSPKGPKLCKVIPNGTITNDKFCMSRHVRLHLSHRRLVHRSQSNVLARVSSPFNRDESMLRHHGGMNEETSMVQCMFVFRDIVKSRHKRSSNNWSGYSLIVNVKDGSGKTSISFVMMGTVEPV